MVRKEIPKKIVPDTSVLVSGRLSRLIEDEKIKGAEIIIPKIVIEELQAQASRGRETGFEGLEEIKKIKEMSKKWKIKITFFGERPSFDDIALAKSGRLDALIQDVAKSQKAVLVTSDLPQAMVAEAEGIKVKYYEAYEKAERMKIEDFLDKKTMSVHLKEGALPYAKRGRPGKIKLIIIGKEKLGKKEMEVMIREIMEAARYEEGGFVEFDRRGASVIQLKNMRIAITRPPFSDALEITVVRPIVKLRLDDYRLSAKLKERLEKKAEGILLAGPPGSGKSTMAASLAEFYMQKGKVVKTMESPRDLQVPKEVTQYSPLEGSFAKTSDILLLVRPDYTIFDEIRRTRDFGIFADMRLAGVGMIGVVHASDTVDAVQRFIGRVELGIIPHVVDTVLFIKDGAVERVYSLSMTVRVPQGMTEADLARPIVEVRDFETGKLEYEIYTYGEQTVVIPAKEEKARGVEKLAAQRIKEEIYRYDRHAQVSFVSPEKAVVRVRNEVVPKIIGKEGTMVKALEERLGISIDIEPMVESLGKEIRFKMGEKGASLVLSFKKKFAGESANIYVDDEYLFSATIGRKGMVKVTRGSDLGKKIIRALSSGRRIRVFI
ncbi:MAG: PINc/VapC family ATPase [Candidatus Aenigmatarchaeota archaeon]